MNFGLNRNSTFLGQILNVDGIKVGLNLECIDTCWKMT